MSTSVLSKLKEGNAPLAIRHSAARGVLPVGQEELLGILVYLQNDPDEEIRQTARQTLANEYNDALLVSIAESVTAPVEVLEFLGKPPLRSPELLEGLIQNRATPDSTIASLAGQVDARLMEVILINLMRLLRSPFILEALEGNRQQTPDITRRLREIREEFVEKRNNFIPIHRTRAEAKAMAPEEAEATAPGEAALVAYSEELREGKDAATATIESLKDDGFESFDGMGEDERLPTIQKVACMTVAEPVQPALKGNQEERIILIRDANRIVATAVLDSPKLSDSEVESIELRLAEHGLGNSPRKILEEFSKWKSMDVLLPTDTGHQLRLRLISQPDQALGILLREMSLKAPKRFRLQPNRFYHQNSPNVVETSA